MPGLSPTIRDRLAARGRVRTLRRGERLIHEGLTGGSVVLVLSGTLRVTRHCGDQEVVLAIRGPGDLLGDLGSITRGRAGATVEARESGRVVVMPSSRFVTAQTEDPEIAMAVLSGLVELLDATSRRLARAQCRTLASRVAEEILELASLDGRESPDAGTLVHVTQSELASLCVASRPAVAEAMAALRSSGLIDTRRGRVTILDGEGLQVFADDNLGR